MLFSTSVLNTCAIKHRDFFNRIPLSKAKNLAERGEIPRFARNDEK